MAYANRSKTVRMSTTGWYLGAFALVIGGPFAVRAEGPKWEVAPSFFSEDSHAPSSMVDAADLDEDGWIDLVFANGGGEVEAEEGSLEGQQAFRYDAQSQAMVDASAAIFGDEGLHTARAVKLRDLDNDGHIDIFLGTTWASQSQLWMNKGKGSFINETVERLPALDASVGDVEIGDIDLDGDLDVVLADWGTEPGLVYESAGAVTRIWLQDEKPETFGGLGSGYFSDRTKDWMPEVKVRWSHDLELADVDNDGDLDILVSSYADDVLGFFLFINDHEEQKFVVNPALPAQKGKQAFGLGVMDLDRDSNIDVVTLHDQPPTGRNRLLRGDGAGGFVDTKFGKWPQLENPASQDHAIAFLDWNSDGWIDLVLGASYSQIDEFPDRLIDGSDGTYEQDLEAFSAKAVSVGSSSIVLADLDGDRRLDVAMAQRGNATEKHVFLATQSVPEDTMPPSLGIVIDLEPLTYPGTATLRLRCHDSKSPLMLHDFAGEDGRPYIEYWSEPPQDADWIPSEGRSQPGVWYGEYLWQVELALPDQAKISYRVCATDAAMLKSCTDVVEDALINGGGMMQPMSDSETSTTTGSGMGDTTASSGSTDTDASVTTWAAGVTEEGASTSGVPTTAGEASAASVAAATTTGETGSGGDVLGDGNGCYCEADATGGPGAGGLAFGLLLLMRTRTGRRRSGTWLT